MKKALITGITGQDGSYLAELLLEKGYFVHGIIRRSSTLQYPRLQEILQSSLSTRLQLHSGDLTDSISLREILSTVMPDEIYNLGAMSHVKESFAMPETTMDINGMGTLRLLEGIKNICPGAKFYQASTSELYGKVKESPQTEKTPFYPRSPYATSKLFAYWSVCNYREGYNMYACNGILFNHESPRRGENFVTRKITLGIAKIKYGMQEEILLGNLDAKRDWGYAKDFVEGMWLMLQQQRPEDFVLATGKVATVREFATLGFQTAGIHIIWDGVGKEEVGIDSQTGRVRVRISEKFFRPLDVDTLCGDASKAKEKLLWMPKTSLSELVAKMVESDLQLIQSSKLLSVRR